MPNPYSLLYEDVWFVDDIANLVFYEGGFVPLEPVESAPEPPPDAPITRRIISSPRYGITKSASR